MQSNERPVQKSSARGTSTRKSGASSFSASTSQDQNLRATQYPETDFSPEDPDLDPSDLPRRTPSSAVRLNTPITRRSSRDISDQAQQRSVAHPNVPARRTQQQQADLSTLPSAATAAPTRPARQVSTTYDLPPKGPRRKNVHWLLYVGLGMLAALALWALGATLLAWGQSAYNTVTYGYPRTAQTDAVVGHNDSRQHPSHFISINLHGQVIIYELPGGDPSKSISYIGPDLVGPGDDQLPVTLSFGPVNHDGKVDMIVHIPGSGSFYFTNNGTKFVPAPNTPTP